MKVSLYDNTMRDGEQTVGVCFSTADKVEIARRLAACGIRRLEAGFAAISIQEQESIRQVVLKTPGVDVYSLARLNPDDVQLAKKCHVTGITLIAPASDVARRIAGNPPLTRIENDIRRTIALAKELRLQVRFSCVDASRAPLTRIIRWYKLAYEAGADTISYPDTSGAATPEKISIAVKKMKKEIRLPLSIHCHNDLGLAVANSLAAVHSGADEVQVTINGLGERAGNTPAEEFILALKAGYGIDLGVDLKALMELSQSVGRITRLEPAFNKPIIGKNVFCHESGMHVRGLIRPRRDTYGPFPPEWVGRQHEVAFGKHSGSSNIRFYCSRTRMGLSKARTQAIAQGIKEKSEECRRGLTWEEVGDLIREKPRNE